MEYEWDPAKSGDCFLRRGFDFAEAAQIFEGPVLDRVDTRRDYGERRVAAIGRIGSELLTLVYTDRSNSGGGVTRRIISARRSSQNERQAYQAVYESR
jgi:hypothetical protein